VKVGVDRASRGGGSCDLQEKRDFYSLPENAVGVRGSKKSGSNSSPQRDKKHGFAGRTLLPLFRTCYSHSRTTSTPFKGGGGTWR
jgi:hypothetical protein